MRGVDAPKNIDEALREAVLASSCGPGPLVFPLAITVMLILLAVLYVLTIFVD